MAFQENNCSARRRPALPKRMRSSESAMRRLIFAGKIAGELIWIDRFEGAFVQLIDRNEKACFAIHDDFLDATDGAGDDGGLASHGLEVDDAEGLVDGRAAEDGGVGVELEHGGFIDHLLNPDDAGAGAWAAATAACISAAISGVSGAPAQRTTWNPGSMWRMALTRWMMPFCRAMRPTKRTKGMTGSMPYRRRACVLRDRLIFVRVDAVVDDWIRSSGISKSRRMSAFAPFETAMTASAICMAVRSTQQEKS